ncbi:GNAT family N-acetyltransferase [Gaetbulibacter aestuarii]|uniref:GNAT family N-acetyltransferase n=1 Tax=Gaetbulibacter aestuarii TaxID=1502358 RepID=A0ABW7MUV5_9FLAO
MIQHKIFNTTEALPKDWDILATNDLFLEKEYLTALEEASPKNIHLYFIAVYNDDTLVGVAVVQLVKLFLNDMFRQQHQGNFKEFIRRSVASFIKGCVLVVGNIMHTGQHGVYFDERRISSSDFLSEINKALIALKPRVRKDYNRSVQAIVLKDYFENDIIEQSTACIKTENFHRLKLQPNMLLNVSDDWHNIDDYKADLAKKYRDRYKRARKKRGALKPVELSLETIKKHSKELYQLYLNVSDNAEFNTFLLQENHFYSLKRHLKDNFKVFGYYDQGKLVGFFSLLLNHDNLETYFLGYDEIHQYPNQLYLNMLYDMLDFGIQNKFKTIVYARTAMAIKSSVGAKAVDMVVYMKHTNIFLNDLFKLIFRIVNPKQDWEERHPFK